MAVGASSLFDNVLGDLYEIPDLYASVGYTQVPVHTALVFMLFSTAILCACADRGPMTLITSAGAAGMVARRLVPAAIVAPILVGWLALAGAQNLAL